MKIGDVAKKYNETDFDNSHFGNLQFGHAYRWHKRDLDNTLYPRGRNIRHEDGTPILAGKDVYDRFNDEIETINAGSVDTNLTPNARGKLAAYNITRLQLMCDCDLSSDPIDPMVRMRPRNFPYESSILPFLQSLDALRAHKLDNGHTLGGIIQSFMKKLIENGEINKATGLREYLQKTLTDEAAKAETG